MCPCTNSSIAEAPILLMTCIANWRKNTMSSNEGMTAIRFEFRLEWPSITKAQRGSAGSPEEKLRPLALRTTTAFGNQCEVPETLKGSQILPCGKFQIHADANYGGGSDGGEDRRLTAVVSGGDDEALRSNDAKGMQVQEVVRRV